MYMHMDVSLMLDFFSLISSIDLFALSFLFVSVEFFLIQVGGHHVRRTETLKLCVYVNKSSYCNDGSSLSVFNIFLMWIQGEWNTKIDRERERESKSFLFASLSRESIYAFWCARFILFDSSYIYFHGSSFCPPFPVSLSLGLGFFFVLFYWNRSWEGFFKTIITKGNRKNARRGRPFQVILKKKFDSTWRVGIYTCWHFLISRHDWTWPLVCMCSLLFSGPERKKGTYTLDRQYQIIVVWERKRGWNKIKFFLFLLIKNMTLY